MGVQDVIKENRKISSESDMCLRLESSSPKPSTRNISVRDHSFARKFVSAASISFVGACTG